MQIKIKLYSILRDKLPSNKNGETTLEMGVNSSLQDLLDKLDINRHVVISVNDEHQSEFHQPLKDGDYVRVFTIIGGGNN